MYPWQLPLTATQEDIIFPGARRSKARKRRGDFLFIKKKKKRLVQWKISVSHNYQRVLRWVRTTWEFINMRTYGHTSHGHHIFLNKTKNRTMDASKEKKPNDKRSFFKLSLKTKIRSPKIEISGFTQVGAGLQADVVSSVLGAWEWTPKKSVSRNNRQMNDHQT